MRHFQRSLLAAALEADSTHLGDDVTALETVSQMEKVGDAKVEVADATVDPEVDNDALKAAVKDVDAAGEGDPKAPVIPPAPGTEGAVQETYETQKEVKEKVADAGANGVVAGPKVANESEAGTVPAQEAVHELGPKDPTGEAVPVPSVPLGEDASQAGDVQATADTQEAAEAELAKPGVTGVVSGKETPATPAQESEGETVAVQLDASPDQVVVDPVVDPVDPVDPTVAPEVPAEPAALEVSVIAADTDAPEEVIVAQALSEAADCEFQQEREEEAVARMTDIAIGLESLVDAMEGMGDRGLSNQNAVFLRHGFEAYMSELGVQTAAFPGMESFGDEPSAIMQSIAMEGIKEEAAKVWAGVRAATKRAFESLDKYMVNIFSAVLGLRARAEKLKAAAAAGEGKGEEIELKAGVDYLTLGGKIPSNLLGEFDKLVKLAKVVVKDRPATALKFDTTIEQIIRSAKAGTADDLKAVIGKLGDVDYPAFPGATTSVSGYGPAKASVKRTAPILGDVAIYDVVPAADYTGDDKFEKASEHARKVLSKAYTELDYVGGYNKVTDKKVKAFSKAEVAKLADEVIALADELLTFKVALRTHNVTYSHLDTAIDDLYGHVGGVQNVGVFGQRARLYRTVESCYSVGHRLLKQPAKKFSAHAISVANAMLSAGFQSLK